MPSDKEPVTKADLNVLRAEIKSVRELLDNELRHLREDVNANIEWRKAFMKENGPWRKVNRRVDLVSVAIVVVTVIFVVDKLPSALAVLGFLF